LSHGKGKGSEMFLEEMVSAFFISVCFRVLNVQLAVDARHSKLVWLVHMGCILHQRTAEGVRGITEVFTDLTMYPQILNSTILLFNNSTTLSVYRDTQYIFFFTFSFQKGGVSPECVRIDDGWQSVGMDPVGIACLTDNSAK